MLKITKKTLTVIGLCFLLSNLLVACSFTAAGPAPTNTPWPTDTPAPTAAEIPPPTDTPVPTATPVLTPLPPGIKQAEGEGTFEMTFGGDRNDRGYGVQQTADGGYIVTGYTQSFGAGYEDVYLIRTDAAGNALWSKTFGGKGKDNGWVALETPGGGFIVTGFTSSFGGPDLDVYLIKTDAEGNLQWEKTFGGPGEEYSWDIAPTTDGGYIIIGQTTSFGVEGIDAYLLKTDADGELEWEKTFGGPRTDRTFSVQQTTDGGYIFTGITDSFGAGDRDVYLLKTSPEGELEWEKTFGGDRADIGHAVRQTSDGGYIVTGYNSIGTRPSDVYLIKTDANGEPEWKKRYGGESEDHAIFGQQTSDGGYIAVGFTGNDGYLIKTDADGELLWEKTFGGAGGELGYAVQETVDGGYIIVGHTWSFGAGAEDVYLIKLDNK